MNLARKSDADRVNRLYLRAAKWTTILNFVLGMKVWDEMLIIVVLILGIGIHYAYPPIPMELISVFLALVTCNAFLLGLAAGISWKRDEMLSEAQTLHATEMRVYHIDRGNEDHE